MVYRDIQTVLQFEKQVLRSFLLGNGTRRNDVNKMG